MARFFNDFDNTASGTNTSNPWDYEYARNYYNTTTIEAKESDPAEKTPTKREQNQDNLRRIREETRKRDQKKLR